MTPEARPRALAARRLKAHVRSLSDEDLEVTGPFVRELTVGQLLGETVPYHVRWHAESIRVTWEQASGRS